MLALKELFKSTNERNVLSCVLFHLLDCQIREFGPCVASEGFLEASGTWSTPSPFGRAIGPLGRQSGTILCVLRQIHRRIGCQRGVSPSFASICFGSSGTEGSLLPRRNAMISSAVTIVFAL